jgi:serine/threonine-protein kinase
VDSARFVAQRYRIEERIGEGAVATVYRGWDTRTHRPVAVKVLKDVHDADDTARLWVELRSLQRVRHPSIIRTLDMGRSGRGLNYIVMELLQGRTLRARMLDAERMPAPDVVAILTQMFEALEACHYHGVIHRDVKPENVFLLSPDETHVKLIDFGMAKLMSDLGSANLTLPHQLFGTPEYMAPERITGGEPSFATDVYAAGVVAFEMLAGQRPFGGRTPDEVMRHQLRHALPRFSELDPPVTVPRALRALIRRCLRKVPIQRPRSQNVVELLKRIDPSAR